MRLKTISMALFTLCLLISVSCKREQLLGLSNGVLFHTGSSHLSSPITIYFVNANPSGKPIPNGVFVDLLGEGADQLYSLGGEEDDLVTNGFINLGVYDTGSDDGGNDDGSGGVDPGEPVKATLFTEVEGFLPSVTFIDIIHSDLKHLVTVQLVDEEDLPPGVSAVEALVSAPGGAVAEMTRLVTPKENGKEERLEYQLEAGTQFLNGNGEALANEVEVQLIHYDNRSLISRQIIAGMSEGVEAFDVGGEPLGRVTLYPAGMHQLRVRKGFSQAVTLDQPALLTLDLNPETLHAQTNQYIKQGDPLQVWWLDEADRVWRQTGTTIVKKENGKLYASFEQAGTGTYVVGTAQPVCETGAQLTLRTGIQAGSCARPFYLELVDVANGLPISFSWSDTYYELYDGVSLRLHNVPQNTIGKIRVWEGLKRCKGALLAESTPFQLCGGNQELSLSEIEQSLVTVSEISVSGVCENNGMQETVWPTTDVLYRPAGCGYYGFLGSLQDGLGCLGAIQPGESYDLQFQVGGESFEFQDVLIQTSTTSISVPGTAEPAVLNLQVNGNSVNMNVQGLPLDPICQQ